MARAGWCSLEATRAQAQRCVSSEKAKEQSSFHQGSDLLSGTDGDLSFSWPVPCSCSQQCQLLPGQEGTALHLCEEPHQPPRRFWDQSSHLPPITTLTPTALLLHKMFSYATLFHPPILWLGLLDYNSLLKVRLVLCPHCRLSAHAAKSVLQPLTPPRPPSWPFHFINAPFHRKQ